MRRGLGLRLIVILALLVASCGGGASGGALSAPTFERPPAPTVPSGWVKYADQVAGFEIWYPPDWELALAQMEAIQTAGKSLIDAPEGLLGGSAVVFFAGRPTAGGFSASVNVVVETLPGDLTVDEFVEASFAGIALVFDDYELHSQTKVSIGESGKRDAFLVEYSATIPGLPNLRFIWLGAAEGRLGWGVTCIGVEEHRQECESSLLSLRLTG